MSVCARAPVQCNATLAPSRTLRRRVTVTHMATMQALPRVCTWPAASAPRPCRTCRTATRTCLRVARPALRAPTLSCRAEAPGGGDRGSSGTSSPPPSSPSVEETTRKWGLEAGLWKVRAPLLWCLVYYLDPRAGRGWDLQTWPRGGAVALVDVAAVADTPPLHAPRCSPARSLQTALSPAGVRRCRRRRTC